MKEIFLSASIPIHGRGNFYKTANPFLIQCAIRELIIATIRNYKIIWGGHPAITPMILAICNDLDIDYSSSVTLYQSLFFQQSFPKDNEKIDNVILVDAMDNDREASLQHMREAMLSRENLVASVFIGGMEGIFDEYRIFKQFQPDAIKVAVPAPGGAALELAKSLQTETNIDLENINFASLFYYKLIQPLSYE